MIGTCLFWNLDFKEMTLIIHLNSGFILMEATFHYQFMTDHSPFMCSLHFQTSKCPKLINGQCKTQVDGFFPRVSGQAIDPIGIHLLCCVHGGKWTATHYVVKNSLVSIARDVGFHVLHEQTHNLLMHLSNHHENKWILCLQQMVLTFW